MQDIRLSPAREQVVLPAASQIRCISPFPTGQEKTAIKIRFENKSAGGHGLNDYLCCSHSSQQEKLPVQPQSSQSPPKPQNTRKHPKNLRETGLPACFRQAWLGGNRQSRVPPEPGRACFALVQRGGCGVCFGSSNLFTHTQKPILGCWREAQDQEGEDALELFKVSASQPPHSGMAKSAGRDNEPPRDHSTWPQSSPRAMLTSRGYQHTSLRECWSRTVCAASKDAASRGDAGASPNSQLANPFCIHAGRRDRGRTEHSRSLE